MKLTTQPKLPAPDSSYSGKSATFEVYRAKDMYDKKWRHPSFLKLVSVARTSYHRYGKRSLFDAYDEKAAIYLVRVSYDKKSVDGVGVVRVHEWLSVRMVPGDGEFEGVGELELYRFNDARVTDLLKEKVKHPGGNFWQYIVSDSRLCGIHPYTVVKKNKVSPVSEKHIYSAECMALMQVQFILDYPPENLHFKYVTAIVRPEIKNKVITLRKDGAIVGPNFISAHTTLGLSGEARVAVDRTTYTYQFPLYWLDMQKLKTLIKTLLSEGKITQKTLDHYLDGYSLDTGDGEIRLAKMLTVKGKLIAATINGTELRNLIDVHVPDAPELQITPINLWRKGFITMVENSGIDVLTQHPELHRFLA